MEFVQKIIECDTPTVNGRVYTKEVLQKSLDENKNLFGYMVPETSASCSMNNIAFALKDYYWENNSLYGKFEVLNTPCGRVLDSLINDTKEPLDISPVGFGMVNSDNEVCDYTLMSFCVEG